MGSDLRTFSCSTRRVSVQGDNPVAVTTAAREGVRVHTERLAIEPALLRMQALASRIWTPEARHHPGQLAWSAAYALPEDLDHGPVFLASSGSDSSGAEDLAWAWLESHDWLEVCAADGTSAATVIAAALEQTSGDVTASTLETESDVLVALVAAGFVEVETPWFTHHYLDLADLPPARLPDGFRTRAVEPGDHERRAAAHRAAWSSTSKVSGAAYERLMRTRAYRADLDHVVEDADGSWVASSCVWLDEQTGVALVEPVGCVPEHRGKGLAGAASIAALAAAREVGAVTGLVCPRGDDDYPVPARLYQRIGFRPGPRTVTLRRPASQLPLTPC